LATSPIEIPAFWYFEENHSSVRQRTEALDTFAYSLKIEF
jgi:hypothetical protein